jgi:hypothetical protein
VQSEVQRDEQLQNSSLSSKSKIPLANASQPTSNASPLRHQRAVLPRNEIRLARLGEKGFQKELQGVRGKYDSEGTDPASSEGNPMTATTSTLPKERVTLPSTTDDLRLDKTLPTIPRTIRRGRSHISYGPFPLWITPMTYTDLKDQRVISQRVHHHPLTHLSVQKGRRIMTNMMMRMAQVN